MKLSEQLDNLHAKAVAFEEIQVMIAQSDLAKDFPDGTEIKAIIVAWMEELTRLRKPLASAAKRKK